jgi:hypothetical protein
MSDSTTTFVSDAATYMLAVQTPVFVINAAELSSLTTPTVFEEEHPAIVERAGMNYREYRWLIANYEADNVVLHRPCSVVNEDLRREE